MRKVPKYIVVILLSYASLFNGCQQAGLNIGEEDMVQSKPAAKMKQDAQASAIVKSPGAELAVTSASDTSPEDKQLAVASSKAVTKRPSTEQPSEEASLNNAKRAKKEAELPGHKAWFTAFIQAVKRIEEDPWEGGERDAGAWDVWEDILAEGREHGFLTLSIICPNDAKPEMEYEYTPLHYVAAKGMYSLVKELIEYENIPVDIQTQNYKNTALHLAASRGHLDVVEFLLEKGADPKLLDHRGGSVLHYAAAGNNGAGEVDRDVIHCLIEKGADFKKIISSGSSMLDIAVMVGNIPVIEYWEDVYRNNPDPGVDVMTKEALCYAKYRFKKHPKERSFQKDIIKILKGVIQYRQEKKKAGNVGK